MKLTLKLYVCLSVHLFNLSQGCLIYNYGLIFCQNTTKSLNNLFRKLGNVDFFDEDFASKQTNEKGRKRGLGGLSGSAKIHLNHVKS